MNGAISNCSRIARRGRGKYSLVDSYVFKRRTMFFMVSFRNSHGHHVPQPAITVTKTKYVDSSVLYSYALACNVSTPSPRAHRRFVRFDATPCRKYGSIHARQPTKAPDLSHGLTWPIRVKCSQGRRVTRDALSSGRVST